MPIVRTLAAALAGFALCVAAALAEPALSRAKALQALDAPAASVRLAGVERLAEIGVMADAGALALRLRDDDDTVRELASAAMWQIWSRSGDAAIDRVFRRGVEQMRSGELEAAVASFGQVVRRKPAFAEGWNKRATVLFMLGRDEESLRDCDEVLRRNPYHFGALSGMAQIHLRRDEPERARDALERALRIHPNLAGGAETLQLLDQVVRARRGQRT